MRDLGFVIADVIECAFDAGRKSFGIYPGAGFEPLDSMVTVATCGRRLELGHLAAPRSPEV
jgi:hypothetical protein